MDELDISGFISAVRGRLFIAAVLSVAISMVGSLLVTTDVLFDVGLGLAFTDAMAVAGVLSLSSLGIVAKVLIDEGCLQEPVGIQIFTGVVIAELLVLFIVGFAISEHAFLDAEGLFVPLFFASAGLNLNLAFLELNPEVIVALILVPLAAKFAGAFFSAYVIRLEAPLAVASGLMATGAAEIALLLVMLHAHVIDDALFSLLVMIMVGYILLTPMGISFALRKVRHSGEVTDDSDIPHLMDRFLLDRIYVKDVLDRTRIYPDQSMTVRSFIDNWTTPE